MRIDSFETLPLLAAIRRRHGVPPSTFYAMGMTLCGFTEIRCREWLKYMQGLGIPLYWSPGDNKLRCRPVPVKMKL
jgi:hypothetical protein